MGFPGGTNSLAKGETAGDRGSIPVLERSPGGGKWQSTQVFLTEKFH